MNYARQSINSDDITAVMRVMESDYLTKGPMIEKFEDAICEYTGAPYCAVVSSGTAALHLAVKTLKEANCGLYMGMTSANTFVASANCLRYNNIYCKFRDIELDTYSMIPYEEDDDEMQILIDVHFAGVPNAPSKVEHVIEDACHSFGAYYECGDTVGSCENSEMTCFSFHPAKTITTGEGGAVTSKNKDYILKIKRLRDHGTDSIGYNYRMTDIQAALGLSQIKRVDEFIKRRCEIHGRYNEEFKGLFKTPIDVLNSSYNLYVAWFDDNMAMLEALNKRMIIAQLHYKPAYRQRWYGGHVDDCPNAEEYSKHALSLPLYPGMTDSDVEYVIKSVKECL